MNTDTNWLDAHNIGLTYGLSARHIRSILHAAYHHKKPWIYKGKDYPLKIKSIPHLAGRSKYLVHKESLPERSELIQPSLNHIHIKEQNLPAQFSPFCDWITIKQNHEIDLPNINNGKIFSIDIDGAMEWLFDKHFPLVGSHDTKILLRVIPEGKGTTVSLSGNISRFGRPDNVFGLTLLQTIEKTNNILSQLSFEGQHLPPFTQGEPFFRITRTKHGDIQRFAWSGATLSRVDLTCNYSLGYRELSNPIDDKADFLNLLSFVKLDRLLTTTKAGQDGRIRTVYWGEQTMRSYNPSNMFVAKVYDKACEVREHYKKEITKNPEYFDNLLNFLETNTLLRFEVQFKRKYLARYQLNYLGTLLQSNALLTHFQELCTQVMDKQIDVTQAERLRLTSKTSYNYYIRWTYGEDIRADITQRTFRHHRKVIADVLGIDISRPCFNRELPTIRTIQAFPVTAPDWYSLDYEMS